MRLFRKKAVEEFLSPMKGLLLNLVDVPDPVFSQKCMGDGFAIELTGNKVVAPLSGEVIASFPTGHAFGIRTKEGIELLIHIGIDTVELNGEGFDVKVQLGDQINQGDTLVFVDAEKISDAGKSLVSPIIFTTGQSVSIQKPGKEIKELENNIVSYK